MYTFRTFGLLFGLVAATNASAQETLGDWYFETLRGVTVAWSFHLQGDGFRQVGMGCHPEEGPFFMIEPGRAGMASRVFFEDGNVPSGDFDKGWYDVGGGVLRGTDFQRLLDAMTAQYNRADMVGSIITPEAPSGTTFGLNGLPEIIERVVAQCGEASAYTRDASIFEGDLATLKSIIPGTAECTENEPGITVCSLTSGAVTLSYRYELGPSPVITLTLNSWVDTNVENHRFMARFLEGGEKLGAARNDLLSCLQTSAAARNPQGFASDALAYQCAVDLNNGALISLAVRPID